MNATKLDKVFNDVGKSVIVLNVPVAPQSKIHVALLMHTVSTHLVKHSAVNDSSLSV